MVEQRFKELDEQKAAEAKVLDEFLGKDAEDAFVDQMVGAFNETCGPDVKETVLLKMILEDVCQSKEAKKEFVKDLLKQDEMIGVGVFGDDYNSLVKNKSIDAVPINEVIQKLRNSYFADKLHTKDQSEIEAIVKKKFPNETTLDHLQVIDRMKSLLILQAGKE